MKRVLTTAQIVNATRSLMNARLTKLTPSDKATVIKAYKTLRKETEDYEELEKVLIDKAKPEGFDDLHARYESGSLTESESADYDKLFGEFNRTATLTLEDEGKKERSAEYAPISSTAMDALIESNPNLTLSQIDLLERVLIEPEKEA